MTYDEFIKICADKSVPPISGRLPESPLLLSLWHDRHGHWDTAHQIVQSISTPAGSVLHAYLHREEGDLSNAQYWYRRAGREAPQITLEAEWESLAEEFCGIT